GTSCEARYGARNSTELGAGRGARLERHLPSRLSMKEKTMGNQRSSQSEMSGMAFPSFLRRFAVAPLPVPASWYALPLRLIVGFGFVEHGYAKLSRGVDAFAAILHAMGTPFAD